VGKPRIKLLVVAAALVAGAAAYFNREPLRLAWLVAAGKSPHCPLSQALRSRAHQRLLTETKDRILAASRRLEEDPAGFVLWETPKGKFWITRGNDYFLPFHLAEQETEIYSAPGIAVRSGDIVLDCGANVGVFARHALEAGARLVVAIEPAPATLECLRRNLAEEIASGRVIVYPKGVWDKDDRLTLYVDPGNTAAASFLHADPKFQQVQQVPLTTVDKLVTELALERVDFIKMDIEGAEPNALRGARQTLARFHPRLAISSYHAPDHPATIPAVIGEIAPGYQIRCGVCSETETGIRPDVLFFY
jgi:FkbM family methyltransferase